MPFTARTPLLVLLTISVTEKKIHGQAHPMLESLLKKLHNYMISNFVMKYWLPKVSGGGMRVPLQMFIFVKTIVHLFNGPCFTELAFSNWFVEVVGKKSFAKLYFKDYFATYPHFPYLTFIMDVIPGRFKYPMKG